MDLEETARAQPATRASTCEWRQQDTPEGALLTKKIGTSTTRYTYDLFGALRHVTLPDGTAIDYVIDGNHRRIGNKLNGTLTSGYLHRNDLNIVA
jgi:YD repeat-containing protein